jgi:hypothetical protein
MRKLKTWHDLSRPSTTCFIGAFDNIEDAGGKGKKTGAARMETLLSTSLKLGG